MTAKNLYFIRNPATGLVKIGVAVDVAARKSTLECAAGVPLEVLAVVEGWGQYERAAHRKLAAHRRKGEWFSPEPVMALLADASLVALRDFLGAATVPVVAPKKKDLAPRQPSEAVRRMSEQAQLDILRIRQRCRDAFERVLPHLLAIIDNPATTTNERLKAQELLAKSMGPKPS